MRPEVNNFAGFAIMLIKTTYKDSLTAKRIRGNV